MRPITVQAGSFAAASATNIAASQSPGAGAIVLNGTTVSGGVATLDVARRVVLTSGGNDAGLTFTISGTNWSGSAISESLAGGNASAVISVLDYKTVSSVTHTGSVATTLTIGTSAATFAASSPWVRLDDYGFGPVSFAVDVTTAGGTIAYTVDQSDDDPNLTLPIVAVPPSLMTWITPPDALYNGNTFTNGSTSKTGSMAARPAWLRLTITAYTGNALATLTVSQAGGRGG